jgi:hypothetical protein
MMEQFSDPLLNVALSSSFLIKFPPFKSKYERILDLFNELKTSTIQVIDDHINSNNIYSDEIEPQVPILNVFLFVF